MNLRIVGNPEKFIPLEQKEIVIDTDHVPTENSPNNKNPFIIFGALLFFMLAGLHIYNEWKPVPGKSGLEYNEDSGEARVTPEHQEKVKEKLKHFDNKLEHCEQYVLLAKLPGYYPCYNCTDKKIFLNSGEVWRYGYSCDGIGRYSPESFELIFCQYIPQYIGTLTECVKREKAMLANYPSLPENIKRGKDALLLPPGNKIEK